MNWRRWDTRKWRIIRKASRAGWKPGCRWKKLHNTVLSRHFIEGPASRCSKRKPYRTLHRRGCGAKSRFWLIRPEVGWHPAVRRKSTVSTCFTFPENNPLLVRGSSQRSLLRHQVEFPQGILGLMDSRAGCEFLRRIPDWGLAQRTGLRIDRLLAEHDGAEAFHGKEPHERKLRFPVCRQHQHRGDWNLNQARPRVHGRLVATARLQFATDARG